MSILSAWFNSVRNWPDSHFLGVCLNDVVTFIISHWIIFLILRLISFFCHQL
jgi:large-conductance mechanosensitive channel